jgi:hypothetical protein
MPLPHPGAAERSQQRAIRAHAADPPRAVLDDVERAVRAGCHAVGQIEKQRLPRRTENLEKLALIGKDENAVVHGIGGVDFPLAPRQPGRTLEFPRPRPEPAKCEEESAFAGELLDAVVGAVFADIEVFLRVLGDAHRVDELTRPRAHPAHLGESVAARVEVNQPVIMRVADDDPAIAERHDSLRLARSGIGHGPLAEQRSPAVEDHYASDPIQDDAIAVGSEGHAPGSRQRRPIRGQRPLMPLPDAQLRRARTSAAAARHGQEHHQKKRSPGKIHGTTRIVTRSPGRSQSWDGR